MKEIRNGASIRPASLGVEGERCIDRFEEAWHQGEVPVIEDYLPAVERLRRSVLVELLHADLERRLERGEAVRVETYLQRYPELSGDADLVLDLLATEIALRRELGPAPALDEYAQRFPQWSARLAGWLPEADEATLRPAESGAAPLRVPAVGEQFAIPGYELLEKLGTGGMGVVYKARQVAADRIVAVKMMLAGARADDEERRRFRIEVAAAARVQHPNIVQIFEVGEVRGCPFFSLEFVNGGSLAERLDGTPWTASAAAALVADLAEAMHAAHQLGVVHRDLKPANILLQEDLTQRRKDAKEDKEEKEEREEKEEGEPRGPALLSSFASLRLCVRSSCVPKITDFGLAKKLDEVGQTMSGAVVGTPSYMAPEQAEGKGRAVGPAADVYALGAILYELLTGRPPFRGTTTLETLAQVAANDPVPPRQLQPQAPRDLETICLKCLEKAAGRRYATARALAEDLRRFADGMPILARPASRREKLLRWARRRPAVALLSLLLMASTVLGLAAVAWQWRQTQANLDRAEASLYAQRIALADREWLAGRVDRTEQLLADCPARGRGWEWHYLRRLCHQDEATLDTGSSFAVAYDPTGRYLAVANDQERALQIVRLEDRHQVLTLPHAGPALAWSPDGTAIASGVSRRGPNGEASADQPCDVVVWEVPSGRELQRLAGHTGAVLSVAFHSEGRLLASGGMDQTIRVWDLPARRQQRTLAGCRGWVEAVAFHPGSRRIASASADNVVRVWDSDSGDPIKSWEGSAAATERGRGGIDSAKGGRLRGGQRAGPSDRDQLTIWSPRTDQELLPWRGQMHQVYCLAFAPDGQRIATGRGNAIKVWETATGAEVHTLRGHTDLVRNVVFAADGKRLASAGYDQTVRLWDMASGDESGTLRGHVGPVNSVAFRGDGRQLASASWDGTVKLWAPSHCGEAVVFRGHRDYVRGLAFHPEGRLLATGSADKTITIWDLAKHQRAMTLPGTAAAINAVAYHPNGTLLASAGHDGVLRLWDTASAAEVFASEPLRNKLYHVAFSPDGSRLATADDGGVVQLWDVEKRAKEQSFSGPEGRAFVTAFQPGGPLLAVAGDAATIQLLDLATGKVQRTLLGHAGSVTHLAFSHDGKHLASSSLDKTIKVWDVASGEPKTLTGHTGAVTSVAFNSAGNRLASASLDRTVKIWDLAHEHEVLSLRGQEVEVLGLVFSPEGDLLAGACVDGTIKLWDATPR